MMITPQQEAAIGHAMKALAIRDGQADRFKDQGPGNIGPKADRGVGRKMTLDLIRKRPGLTSREMRSLLGFSQQGVSYHITALSKSGHITRSTDNPPKYEAVPCKK